MKALAPWAGWIGGILGWMFTHQTGSDLTQTDCTKADLPVMLAIAFIGAALVILGALVSLRVWRGLAGDLEQPYAGARRFIAATGGLAAGIFLLAIVFQTLSSFIIPQCHA
jgi:hypothetical protein